MIPSPTFNVSQAPGLRRFAYTEAECGFLQIVALHSGYFLRRQYAAFLNRADGGRVSQLIEKALAHEHVRASSYRQKLILYHLCARPFYSAIGQEDNRHRRRRGPANIKCKLMALDFVLTHRDASFLATESEKTDFFTRSFGLPVSALPSTLYRAHRGSEMTTRYFVEKYPIFWAESSDTASPPVVTFCFIDEGLSTLSHFETFLGHYGRLWALLPRFELVYVATSEAPFAKAQTAFERFSVKWQTAGEAGIDSDVSRLLAHFEARQRYAAKDLTSFDRAALIRFRNERDEFSGPDFDSLYAAWQRSGVAAVQEHFGVSRQSSGRIEGRFSTHLLPYDYDVFSSYAPF